MANWNDELIAALRANLGEIADGPMAGRPLLVLTSKGAKSGEPREAVLTFSRDDGRYVVCATAGGSPTRRGRRAAGRRADDVAPVVAAERQDGLVRLAGLRALRG